MAQLSEVLAQLEAAGTGQNRKVYARHGAAQPMFGVSYAALDKIGGRPNRVRHEMNGAMIVMALRHDSLRQAVLAVANRIGPVQVDHGQTGCKTPEVAPNVERTLAHRARRAARQAQKAAKRPSG